MFRHNSHNPLTDLSNKNIFRWKFSPNAKLKKYPFRHECECFQTRENRWKHEAASAKCFYCFQVVKHDARCFLNDFSKETIQNYVVLHFSHFSLKCHLCVICCIHLRGFGFNDPVVSHSYSYSVSNLKWFTFCQLFPSRKEGFVSQKQSKKKNFA